MTQLPPHIEAELNRLGVPKPPDHAPVKPPKVKDEFQRYNGEF